MYKPARVLVCEEAHRDAPATEWNSPVVLWLHDGPVCVRIVDAPRRDLTQSSCRCGGCRAAHHADWAAMFLD
jgi:hypothetical protein